MTDVTVTQEDRDIYDELLRRIDLPDWTPCDPGSVELLARHRQSSTEEVERLREALQGMLDRYDAGHPQTADTVTAARTALTGATPHDD